MAELIVRDIDDEIVRELELRAARNGQSTEDALRQILFDALGGEKPAISLKDYLSTMPDVGEDSDFERVQDHGRTVVL